MSIQSRYPRNEIVFEHWKVEKHLGSGSNGKTAVFVLTHTNSDQIKSALKVVNLITEDGSLEECTNFQKEEYLSARETCTKTAVQEVLLMNGLQGHANIVAYLDHAIVDWEEDGCFGRDLLIRMELLTDLRKLMLQGKLFSEEEVIRIGTDICAALSVCHQKNILHRDIKPENIFVSSDGVYKLGDFGISRILDSAGDARASTGVGTPQYAAPEQFSLEYDKRVDLYSLGLVLYELRNGNHLPFTESRTSMPEYVRRRLSGETFPELKQTSPELSAAIFRACQFRPDERFCTAEDFSAALHGPALAESSPTPLPEQKPSFDIRKLLPGITAVLAILLVVSLALRKPPAQEHPEQTAALQAAPVETAPPQTEPVQVDIGAFSYETLSDGTISITGYDGTVLKDLMIPAEIDGKPVTRIGQSAFLGSAIRSLVIPEGVTIIELNAFVECENLEQIVFPDSLRTIDSCTFIGCRKLKEVHLPDGLLEIGENAFNATGITSIFIPASVVSLDDTFLSCGDLRRIDVAVDNPYYSSKDGILFNKDKTTLIRYPANHPSGSYCIPESVAILGNNAFEGSNLHSLDLPKGLRIIGEGCFYMASNLRSLTIPSTVHTIAEGSISNCESLESILVAKGNKTYTSREGTLYTANMKTLVAVPSAGRGVFTIPDSVTSLAVGAFRGSHFSRVIIPGKITIIPDECFEYCYSLKDITLPEGLKEIRWGAFSSCISLSTVEIPKSVRYIGNYAFAWCDELKEARILNPQCIMEEESFSPECRVDIPIS